MSYRATKKRNKLWSQNANAKKERLRVENAEPTPVFIDPDDDEIEIIIKRKLTNETAVFHCTRGTRIDNYRVYCNEQYKGVQSITTLTQNIRKALPSFRRIYE